MEPQGLFVVSGEASETDSDIEDCKPQKAKSGGSLVGKDPVEESEQEISPKISSVPHQKETRNLKSMRKKSPKKQNDSLLHRKLRENNDLQSEKLYQFWSSAISDAQSTLTNNIEQQLVKTQLTLQASLTSLRLLTAHTNLIRNKLGDILVDTNYLDKLIVN